MSKIQIVCSKCGNRFNEHHSKIRGGLSVNCLACNQPVIFEGTSEDPNVRKALIAARRFRLSSVAGAS